MRPQRRRALSWLRVRPERLRGRPDTAPADPRRLGDISDPRLGLTQLNPASHRRRVRFTCRVRAATSRHPTHPRDGAPELGSDDGQTRASHTSVNYLLPGNWGRKRSVAGRLACHNVWGHALELGDLTDRRTLVSKPDPLFDGVLGAGHEPQDAWCNGAATTSVVGYVRFTNRDMAPDCGPPADPDPAHGNPQQCTAHVAGSTTTGDPQPSIITFLAAAIASAVIAEASV